jgi:hypothetical protein
MQFVTPDMIAKIASYVGIDRGIAQKAIGGAVPALLAGLADLTATPSGARQVSNLAQRQADSLDNLKGLIGNADQQPLVESGSTMLSGLFGGGAPDAIGQAIGKFAGVGEGSGKKLIAMLAPLVLGVLGQQQRSGGLDASGLASLLGSQRDQIAAAIPSGLADQLSATGLMDKMTRGMRGGAEAASATGARFAQQVSGTGRAAQAASSQLSPQWAFWVVGLVILGGLIWYLVGRPADQMVSEAPPPAQTQPQRSTVGVAPSNSTDQTMNLANQSVDSLRSTLPTITDAASAQAALPKLRDTIAQLRQLKSQSANLSPEAKATVAKTIAAAKPGIDAMLDKVTSNPDVATIAKPAIDTLREQLNTLAQS